MVVALGVGMVSSSDIVARHTKLTIVPIDRTRRTKNSESSE